MVHDESQQVTAYASLVVEVEGFEVADHVLLVMAQEEAQTAVEVKVQASAHSAASLARSLVDVFRGDPSQHSCVASLSAFCINNELHSIINTIHSK